VVRRVYRTASDLAFWIACWLALALVVGPAVWIVVGLVRKTWPVLSVDLLLRTTAQGGLQNALFGTLVLAAGVLILAAPIGIGAGVYMAEFASPRQASLFRFFSEVLAGIPSIVVGYASYELLAITLGWGYSVLGGILALTALVLPYVVKSTEAALQQVPTSLREGASALGLPRWLMLWKVLLPPALPGILTGLVVALAISTGETAPLLYTANFSDANPPLQLLHHPVGYLTYVVYDYIQLPSARAHQLANAAATFTLFFLLLLILLSRLLATRARRRTEQMGL
jgi:phosphate transport system permease protein